MLAVGSRTVRIEYTRPPGPDPQRSRATAMAETAAAPAATRAAPQAARVAPVVTTSSTSRTQRPAMAAAAPRGPPEPEGAGDVGGPLVAAQLELGDGRAAAFQRPLDRQIQALPGHRGDEGGLVIAAPPLAIRVHRDGHDQLRPDADPRPATGDGDPQRDGQPLLAPVLQLVQRAPDRAGVRSAPLELEERRRDVRRQADGRPGRQTEPRIERRQAVGAQRRPFAAAARARGRQGEVEEAGREPSERRHAPDGDRPCFTRTFLRTLPARRRSVRGR